MSQIGPFTQATITLPGIRSIEWFCERCFTAGPGVMPDYHASGSCEATRTMVLPTGYTDGGGI